ncbi:peptidyl-prolyl cis-trans isomerase [Lactococcus chungangensis]
MKQYHQDMKGKIILNLKKIGLIAVTGVAAVTLAACGQDGANSDIVTMKGDTIRVSDLYKEAKQYPSTGTATLLQNMTFNKIFEKEFGKKVSEKDVNKEFDTQKTSLGSNFASALQQAGYTEASYKDSIRSQLLLKEVVTSKIKFTDAEYKAAFETYHPTVETYILPETTEDAAKKLVEDAKNDAGAFDKSAKEKKAEMKFDSSNAQIPEEVKTAAFKLKDGEVSAEPISVTNAQTGTKSFYVVKMIKNADKGTDWKKYKKELKQIITTNKQNDATFVNGIIASYLKDYNVKVKPTEFSNIFSSYEAAVTGSSSSSKSK